MAITDPIGDMITRIRNGHMRGMSSITSPASKQRERVLQVLKQEGFIRGFSEAVFDNGRKEFTIELKYHNGRPVIRDIKRVSKPGRRVYSPVDELPYIADGLGVSIISTTMGVMSDAMARQNNVGGEVLCNVF